MIISIYLLLLLFILMSNLILIEVNIMDIKKIINFSFHMKKKKHEIIVRKRDDHEMIIRLRDNY